MEPSLSVTNIRTVNFVILVQIQKLFIAWPISVFTPKQVFGPRTAKSQPIWIIFCTHLLLYGIHLDRDRRVGGSRPNQND